LVIGLAAFFIFGPERLPTLAREAARGQQRARAAVNTVREQMGDELGEVLAELDLRRYHPAVILRDQLLGEDRAEPPAHGRAPTAIFGGPTESTLPVGGGASAATPRDRTLPPPFDLDAT
jgi:sec-independent protein translocase protein TatB